MEGSMNRPSPRATRIYLPLLVAGLVALATLAMSARHADAQTHPARHAAMGSMQTTDITARQLAFRNRMRVLWEQHVAWTRMAIVSFGGGLPDLPATEHRLLRNQTDIGNAIAPFYGTAAGDRLTALLRRHILIAVDILVDVKAGDTTKLAADSAAWTRNANRISAFLHHANPVNWPLSDLRAMMHRHLRLTANEAVAELSGNYTGSVRAYDRVEREILGMADMLSTGIIQQFPHRFD
jgi:hypothetical protein